MDTLNPKARSERMALIRCKNTRPEMLIRRMLHAEGYRFRLHQTDLPGKPDLVFASRRKVIFIHGCFWHRHCKTCPLTRLPKSRLDFWLPKLESNRLRDARNVRRLRAAGWRVLTVWECQLNKFQRLFEKIVNFLEGDQ